MYGGTAKGARAARVRALKSCGGAQQAQRAPVPPGFERSSASTFVVWSRRWRGPAHVDRTTGAGRDDRTGGACPAGIQSRCRSRRRILRFLYGDRVRAVVWSETFSGVRSRWVGSLPMRRMTVSWRYGQRRPDDCASELAFSTVDTRSLRAAKTITCHGGGSNAPVDYCGSGIAPGAVGSSKPLVAVAGLLSGRRTEPDWSLYSLVVNLTA